MKNSIKIIKYCVVLYFLLASWIFALECNPQQVETSHAQKHKMGFDEFFKPVNKKKKKEPELKNYDLPQKSVINWPFVIFVIILSLVIIFIISIKRATAFRELLKMIGNVICSKPSFRNYFYMVKRIFEFIHQRLGHKPKVHYYEGSGDTEVM